MSTTEPWASFPAFAGTAIVQVADSQRLGLARRVVERTVAAFDLACSRFRDDSELSALNRAQGSAVRASPLLLDAVMAALRAARLTDGDVDPTVGEALIALGYDRDFSRVHETGALVHGAGALVPGAGALVPGAGQPDSISFAAVPGWRTIRIDHDHSTIRLDPGVRLDLGATAKALAADRAATAAQAQTGCGVLVSFGGDIAMAGQAPADGWRVRVTDDHRSGVDAPGQSITLHSGGLATSSTSVRRWKSGDATLHHVIDPADGRPAAGVWRTVSVAAASCLDANIAATAAIVRGQPAVDWLQSLRLPSRLVSEQGDALHLAGWPAQGDDLAPRAAVAEVLT